MANRFLNNIKINDSYTLPAADGTADQVITTDGSGQLSFVDQSTLAVDSAEVVEVPVKNLQGSALTKGDPVYISGSVGSSGRLEVQLADAGNTAKMPAVGLLKQDLAINGEGYVVVTGKLRNLVTSPIDSATPSEGDVLYVKSGGSTGAALTTTKPTGTNLIQNMGKVGRVSTSSDGTFIVSSILRANDVPTPLYVDHSNQRLGIGETSPGTILDVKGASPYITLNTTSTYTSWGIKAESSGNSKGRLEWVSNSFLQFGAGVILTSGSSYIQIPDSTTYDFHLNLVGNRVMQIDSGTGTVGIGTTVGLSAAPAYGVQPNLVLGSDTSTTGGVLSLYNYDTTIEAGDTLGIIQFVGKDDASSSSGYTAATIRTYTNTAMGQGNPGGGEMVFSTAGTIAGSSPAERMRITSSGNVGIGTDNPAVPLHVDGFARFNGGLQLDGNNRTIYAIDNTDLLLGANNAEKIRIKANGNVGIGTTGPSEKLEVQGSVNNDDVAIRIENTYDDNLSTSRPAAALTFATASNNGYLRVYGAPADTAANHQIDLGATATNSYLTFSPNNSEKMRIASSGNVGIGTTNPGAKLEVNGNIAINAGQKIQLSGSSDSTHHIYHDASTDYDKINYSSGFQLEHLTNGIQMALVGSSGRVGIGTTSPSEKLEVAGNTILDASNANLKIKAGTTGTKGDIQWTFNTDSTVYASVGIDYDNRTTDGFLIDSGYPITLDYASSYIRFSNNGSEKMRINTSGNVGIGTTNPQTKLHVDQTANAQGIRVESDNVQPSITFVDGASANNDYWEIGYNRSGERLVFEYNDSELAALRENGNFGVGVTTPSSKLHVGGTARFNDYVIAGSGSGGVGLTDNDGYGNANVTFNHVNGTPEQNGQSARIVVNTDNTTDEATMEFELSSSPVTSGTAIDLPVGLKLAHDYAEIPYRLTHAGDTDTYLQFDTDRIRLAAGGTTFLDSDITYTNGTGTADYIPKWSDSDTLTDSVIREVSSSIGIGKSPQSGFIFDANGAAVIRGNVYTSGDITKFNSGALTIRNSVSGQPITFATENTSERMRITAAGNVGIGTTSPDALLDIGTNNIITLDDTGSSTGFIGMGSYNDGTKNRAQGASYYGFGLEIDRPNQLIRFNSYDSNGITSSGTDILALKRDGNVGIGTSSPDRKLEVDFTNTTYGARFTRSDNAGSSLVEFANSSGVQNVIGYDAGFHGFKIATASTTNVAIEPDGNVGFGTTNPNGRLHISGISQTGTRTALRIENDTSNSKFIVNSLSGDYNLQFKNAGNTTRVYLHSNGNSYLNGGNVGFGTDSPSAKVHASDGGTIPSLDAGTMFLASNTSGTGDYSSMSIMSGTAGIASLFFGDTDAEKRGAVRYLNSSEALRFRTANTDRLSIKSNGFVGINTTDPLARLHVVGSEGIAIANGSNTKTTLIPSGGGNSELTLKGQNYVHYVNYETSWNSFRYARFKSSYNTSDSELYLYKSDGSGGTAATTTISTGASKFAGSIGVNTTSVRSTLDVNGPLSVVGGTFTSGASGADSNGNSGIVVRRGKRILSGIPNGAQEDFLLRNLIWQTTGNNIEIGQLGTSLIGDISLQAGSSGNIKFFGSGSEDMRVNSSGNVCIGNTNNTYALDVTGTIRATGDVIAYSDIRVKENIKTIDNALDKVKALRGVEYNKIDSSEKSIGVIAQEIEEIIPQVVKEDEVGMKSVAYGNITAVLIEAIKEQQKQIDQLKAIIDGST